MIRDPEKRLGKKGTQEVKDHPFFAKAKGFSWKDAFERKVVALPSATPLSLWPIEISLLARP